jgi:hypothetical protein
MTEEDRWLDAESEALGRHLIAAGRAEQPARAALGRTLVAIGAGAAVTSLASKTGAAMGASIAGAAMGGSAGTTLPTAASGTVAGVVLGKWLAGAAVVGVAAFGTVELVDDPAPVVTPSSAPAIASSEPVEGPARVQHSEAPPAETLLPHVELRPAPRAVRPRQTQAEPLVISASGPSAVPPVRSPLEEELALIDDARALLEGGKPGAAIDKLSEHDQRFARGSLRPEALFLRMEAHSRLGDHGAAKRAAERIVARAPNGPHAARAREVLER